jgi:hypothetical protein
MTWVLILVIQSKYLSMTKKPHDQFAKQYLKGMLSPFGEEVEISLEVPPGESQQVDVWFVPRSRQPVAELGVLGRMVTSPSLLEAFRNPISEDDLFACIEKLCKIRGEMQRIAKREKRKILPCDRPHLWMLVPTASVQRLEGCHALRHKDWGEGFFFLGETLRIGFVVIHQLPVVPETLLLRLLGRDEVQRQAGLELLELPEQPLKAFALEKFTKLTIMLKNRRSLSKEDEEIMLNIDVLYDEWRTKTLQEGREEGRERSERLSVEALLMAKFGAIDGELEGVIPVLLRLDPIDRARVVMQRSRESLLELGQ